MPYGQTGFNSDILGFAKIYQLKRCVADMSEDVIDMGLCGAMFEEIFKVFL